MRMEGNLKRRTSLLLAFVMIGSIANGLLGEAPARRSPSGPEIGTKVSEFRSQPASRPHLCWSCYG